MKLLLAVLFGIITHIVRKLGPSVVLFVLVYASQHMDKQPVIVAGIAVPLTVVLLAAVVTFSIAMVVFKSTALTIGKRLDKDCLPQLDGWVLRKLHRYDLSIKNIRRRAILILEAFKIVALFLALTALGCLHSIALGLAFLLSMLVIAGIAYLMPNPHFLDRWPKLKSITDSDNYAELIFDFALIIGFLVILPKGDSGLSGIMILLLGARFSGQLKTLAKTVRAFHNWRSWIRSKWSNRSQTLAPLEEPDL